MLTLLLGMGILVAVPALAGPTTSVGFTGTDVLQHRSFSVGCSACVPGKNTIGARVSVDVSATWAPNATIQHSFTPTKLRQGQTLDLVDTLTPGSGPLTVTWSASGDAGEYNTDPSSGPVFPNDGSNEHTVGASASQSSTATCNFGLNNDATITCTASTLIHLTHISLKVPPWDIQFNVSVITNVVITPDHVVTVRTAAAGTQTLASGGLTFNGPSPGVVNDPLAIPCTLAPGTDVGYALTGYTSDPGVSATTKLGLNVHFDGPASPSDLNVDLGSVGPDGSTFHLTASSTSTGFGQVLADQDPPVANPGGGAGNTYPGTEGAAVAFNGAASSDPHCGPPTLSWVFGDSSPAQSGATPTHTYLEEGTYNGTLTATNAAGLTATTPFTVIVADAALTGSSVPALSQVEGAGFGPVPVATFTDADPNGVASDYSATINWGDGTLPSTGTIGAAGTFTVTGSHVYLEEGTYPVTVAIADSGGSTTSVGGSVVVADAALTATPVSINAANPVIATVANFTDADPNGTVSDYSATINWGDGTLASAGSVIASGSGFGVQGTHTYAPTGPFSFTVKIHICDAGGSCTDATSTIKITYMTGRSYGLGLTVGTLLGSVSLLPTPDTGSVQNSLASATTTPCTGSVVLTVAAANAMCVKVTTSIGPGSSSANATVAHATINTLIPGIPVIDLTTVAAKSQSSCGFTTGSTTIDRLIVGGHILTTTTTIQPNTTINLPSGAKLILNEQIITVGPGGDRVLTVNAVHLIVPAVAGLSANVVAASATSDIHNCP
jgi:hypothetical protein